MAKTLPDVNGDVLKRFQGALRGARLSGTAAHQINEVLCAGKPYKSLCEQGEKLPGIYKLSLQQVVDEVLARGVRPSTSLLTPCQKRAVRRRQGQ